jgi:hypothetical protein
MHLPLVIAMVATTQFSQEVTQVLLGMTDSIVVYTETEHKIV